MMIENMSLKEVLKEYESWKSSQSNEDYDEIHINNLIRKFLEHLAEKGINTAEVDIEEKGVPFNKEDLLSDRFMF